MSFLEDRANLEGKIAMVVGGGGGLGRAAALDLARAGVRLALCDRNGELLTETVATIAAEGGSVILQDVFDAREPEALADFFTRLDALTDGKLDVLVNIVGGTFRQTFADSNPRGWDALIRTNFTWLLHSTHLAIPRMRRTGSGGSIINFTSIEAHRAAPGFAVYAGMKGGVTNFTRTLAVELAPEGIRINTVAADMTPTEGTAGIAGGVSSSNDAPELEELRYKIGIPAGRHGTYPDIGNCVLFLASDMSRYITGTSMHPDGGALASSGWFNWPEEGFRNSPPTHVVEGLLARQKGS